MGYMSEVIYFGRPISTYSNEKLEKELIPTICAYFNISANEIIDPKLEVHQNGVQEYRKKFGNGMEYFYQEILPQVSIGVFLAFVDGMIGAGVWGEASFLKSQGKPIHEISYDGVISELLLEESRRLSVEQTRARIYSPTEF
jgi:hypothetical protein